MASPTILPNSTAGGTINGTAWRKVRQYSAWSNGEEMTTLVYKGPYSQLALAYESLRNTAAGAQSITPQASEGSALASITVVIPVPFAQWSPLPHEIKPPIYDIIPVSVSLDLRTMFLESGVSPTEMDTVDKALRDGTAGSMDSSGFLDGTKQYLAWKLLGVNSFERTTHNLRVQYFFDNARNFPSLVADYAAENCVYTWANIRPLSRPIPSYITEPKASGRVNGKREMYTSNWSTATLEWRLVSVGPQYQGKAASIAWEFHGAIGWGSAFYNGGGWTPP